MKAFMGWYKRTYRKWPYPTAFVTCYLKGSIADVITQTNLESPKIQSTTETLHDSVNIPTQNQSSQPQSLFETTTPDVASVTDNSNNSNNTKKTSSFVDRLFSWFNRIDWMRNWRFSMYSGLYCGCVQHVVYCIVWPWLIPEVSLRVALFKTIADATIHVPLLYFPVYFAMKSTFLGGTPLDGLKKYFYEEKWKVLVPYWKVWLPVMLCVFYIIPYEFRVGTIGAVSLLWLVLLSYISPMIHQETETETETEIKAKTKIKTQTDTDTLITNVEIQKEM